MSKDGAKGYVLIWLPAGTEATTSSFNDLTLPETGALYLYGPLII